MNYCVKASDTFPLACVEDLGSDFGGQDLVSASFRRHASTWGRFEGAVKVSASSSRLFWPHSLGLNLPPPVGIPFSVSPVQVHHDSCWVFEASSFLHTLATSSQQTFTILVTLVFLLPFRKKPGTILLPYLERLFL